MRLFVVGKLGEVVKKILELEDLIRDNPSDKLLTVELAGYNDVIRMWPVLDDALMHRAIQIFKLNIAKLKEAETHLRATALGDPFMFMAMSDYFKYLDNVRSDLKTLNELGMHIGPSPFLEVVDANMAQTQVEHTT